MSRVSSARSAGAVIFTVSECDHSSRVVVRNAIARTFDAPPEAI